MWREYADAFVGADVVVITDIYPSGTTPIPGVTGKLIVNAVSTPTRWPASCGCPGATTCLVPRRRGRSGRRLHLDGLRRHRHAAGGDPARRVAPAAAGDHDRPMSTRARCRRRCARARRDPTCRSPRMTTYRVGGPAALFVRARSLDDLARGGRASASGLPVLVVGRGSNLLVAERGFPGIAVSPDWPISTAGAVSPPGPVVVAGGGVALPVLARRTAAAGLTGFEWAVGVPGIVGGAVRMNAGGHGSDMAACFVDVDVSTSTAATRSASARRPASWACASGAPIGDRARRGRGAAAVAAGDREAAEARSPRSSAGAGSTSPAARTPARSSSTRCPARSAPAA